MRFMRRAIDLRQKGRATFEKLHHQLEKLDPGLRRDDDMVGDCRAVLLKRKKPPNISVGRLLSRPSPG